MQSTLIYRASGVAGYQVNQYPVLSQCFARSLYNGQIFCELGGAASRNFSFLLFNGQKSAVCWVCRWENFFCGSRFQLRWFSKPCAAIELAKLCRWARLPQPSGCVKQGLGKALPNKIPMGQNERNAKSGTSVESCSLLLLTSLHFTTDIFSAKSRGVFVNILWTSCRRPPFVAATLSAFTVSHQRWDCDMPTVTLVLPLATFDQSVFLSPYPYYNFKSAFWPDFRKIVLQDEKRTVCIAKRS